MTGLTVMPDGPDIWFHDIAKGSAPVHHVRIGTGAHNEIIIQGEEVTDTHCILCVTEHQVEVSDFGPPARDPGQQRRRQ